MSNFETLRDVMASTLDISPDVIRTDSSMEDIKEWDSLGHVQIMVALEQSFDVYLDVEDFAELTSVQRILDYVSSR